jgi:hypothetical protein
MIAPHDRKKPTSMWKFSFFYLFYPGSIYTYWHLVFRSFQRVLNENISIKKKAFALFAEPFLRNSNI